MLPKFSPGIRTTALPEITAKFGSKSSIQGRAQDREETFADMKVGVLVALTTIEVLSSRGFSPVIRGRLQCHSPSPSV